MRSKVFLVAVLFEGGLAVAAWVLGWALGYAPFHGLGLSWHGILWGIFYTGPLLVAMASLAHLRWGPLRQVFQYLEGRVIPCFSECSVFQLALISALAGFGEEALFRGVIQRALSEWWNPWVGLVVASALFGLGHHMTSAYAILAGLLGLYLGLLLMVFDNLLVVMLVHGLYDFAALVYLVQKQKVETGWAAG